MVQAVENLTAIVVRVMGVVAHPTLSDWDQLDVQVIEAAPVDERADLLSQRVGERLPMAIRRDLARDVEPGCLLSCRAKLHLGEVMAEAMPDPADFSVAPPERFDDDESGTSAQD